MKHSPCLLPSPTSAGVRTFRYAKIKELRVFRVKGFETILILYLPLPDGVDILTVVHGSRNLQALLRREGLE
jgi:hypothetical protein